MEENKVHGNSKYHKILTKIFLQDNYYTKGMSWIEKYVGTHRSIILRYLKKFNLPIIKISETGRKIKSKQMTDRMTGKSSWRKGVSEWERNPEGVLKMIKTQIKQKHITKGSFKKGKSPSIKGKGSRKNLIHQHHIDLNTFDSRPSNVLYLTTAVHMSIHKRAYDYLVKIEKIDDYIEWFIKKFNIKLYTKEQCKKQILRRK